MVRASSILLATFIFLRCGDPAAPPVQSGIVLTLRLSAPHAGPGEVLVAEAAAFNRMPASILYSDGCGEEDGIWFDVHGPDGRRVLLAPPGVGPACATRVAFLPPAGSLEASLHFNGTLYRTDGEPYAAPAGRYVVVARFRWWANTEATNYIVQEERQTFVWDAATDTAPASP